MRLVAVVCLLAVVVIAPSAANATAASAAPTSGAWRVVASPNDGSSSLSALSCPAANVCEAVGAGDESGASVPLFEGWDGSTWRLQTPPKVSAGSLAAISCPVVGECVAVGSSESSGVTKPLLAVWNGTAWTQTLGPNGVFLNGVSCATASSCIAVGSRTTSAGLVATLAVSWNGTTWSVMTTPNEPGFSDYFNAVSCTTPTACTAVGGVANSEPQGEFFAARWNGSVWSTQSTPDPKGTFLDYLNGVSCPTATTCVAVGTAENQRRSLTYQAEIWNGTTWELQPSANPDGSPGVLAGVACVAADACTAAGTGSISATLIEGWNGTTWTTESPVNPSGQPSLAGVACTAAASCTVVGQVFDPSSETSKTLVESD